MEEVATLDDMSEATKGRLIIALQPTLTATRPWNWTPSTQPNNVAKDQPTRQEEGGKHLHAMHVENQDTWQETAGQRTRCIDSS